MRKFFAGPAEVITTSRRNAKKAQKRTWNWKKNAKSTGPASAQPKPTKRKSSRQNKATQVTKKSKKSAQNEQNVTAAAVVIVEDVSGSESDDYFSGTDEDDCLRPLPSAPSYCTE